MARTTLLTAAIHIKKQSRVAAKMSASGQVLYIDMYEGAGQPEYADRFEVFIHTPCPATVAAWEALAAALAAIPAREEV